jgi:hypothetical protein
LLDAADGKPKELVDATHPAGIAARKVVVYGHYVNASSRLRIPCHRRCRSKRFPFSRLHLGNSPIGQGHGALELHVKHLEPKHSYRRNRSCRYEFE